MESGKMSSDTVDRHRRQTPSTDTVYRHRRQTPHFLLYVYQYKIKGDEHIQRDLMSHAPMSPQGCRLFAAALVVAVARAADGATHGIRVQVPSRDEGSAGAPTNPALARPAGSSPANAKGHLRSSSEVPPGKGQLSGRTPGGNGLPGPRLRVLDERRPPVPPPPPPPQTAPPPDWAPPPAWADQSQELEEQLERLADRDALEKQAPSWTVGRRWWWWWVTDEPVYKKERTHNATDLIPTRCSHHGHEEDCARTRGLALMLDSGTRKSHTLAAPTAFVTGRGGGFFFFRGVASPQEQAELAASFFYIYNAIEEAIDTCADVRVKNMDFARLRRAKALQKDMAFFYGTNGTWEGSLLMWHDIAPPTTATNAYLLRLERAMELDKQHLLIAHMYSGYLGTLFGGQVAGVTSLKNDHKRSTQPISGSNGSSICLDISSYACGARTMCPHLSIPRMLTNCTAFSYQFIYHALAGDDFEDAAKPPNKWYGGQERQRRRRAQLLSVSTHQG